MAADHLAGERRARDGAAHELGLEAFAFAGAVVTEGEDTEADAKGDDEPCGRAAGEARGFARSDVYGGDGSTLGRGWSRATVSALGGAGWQGPRGPSPGDDRRAGREFGAKKSRALTHGWKVGWKRAQRA